MQIWAYLDPDRLSKDNDVEGLEEWRITRNRSDWYQFWKKSRYICMRYNYSTATIDEASSRGHIDVLDWWYKNSKELELMYTNNAIILALMNGHLNVLDWWYNHSIQFLGLNNKGLLLNYDNNTIKIACACCSKNIKVLDWFRLHSKQVLGDKGLEMKFEKMETYPYSDSVMEWLNKNNLLSEKDRIDNILNMYDDNKLKQITDLFS